jgi:L-amino acid N-acyltransferase YncA
MTAYRLRLASAADAEQICRIYNQGIEDRVATLEVELRTPDERREWLESRSPRHPVIVAEHDEGEIAGWASLNVFNPREAYRFVADISVYVERSWRGKGAGRVLLERLVELGRQHGFHKLVLAAFPFNESGMALYERLGFQPVGIYREQGQLDGKWVDTIVMERLLSS